MTTQQQRITGRHLAHRSRGVTESKTRGKWQIMKCEEEEFMMGT